MTQITLWAIKEKGTGNFMPEIPGWKKAYTHHEPEPVTKYPPRLFMRRQSAQIALTYWLQGTLVSRYDDEGEGYLKLEAPVTPRIKENMEIVSFTCIENA